MSSKKAKSSHIFDILRSEFGNPDYGLKEFKHDVSRLKKFGLVSKKVDARKQKPTRYMRDTIRQFVDVLKGEAQVFSVPKSESAIYKSVGHRVKGQKVVVTAPKGTTVKRAKPVNGNPQYTTSYTSPKTGHTVNRTITVFPANDLRARLRAHIKNLPPLHKGEYYAFRFKGYNSKRYFSGADAKSEMFAYLDHYLPAELEDEDLDDYLMHFEFVTIEDTGAWAAQAREQQKETKERNAGKNNDRRNAWFRQRYNRMTESERAERNKRGTDAKKNDKNYHKKKREELKRTNPDAYRAMLDANAARMKKSRANRKK